MVIQSDDPETLSRRPHLSWSSSQAFLTVSSVASRVLVTTVVLVDVTELFSPLTVEIVVFPSPI